MGEHRLHALLLPPGPALLHALEDALGGGPAIAPLPWNTPQPVVNRLLATIRPHAVITADGQVLSPPYPPVPIDPTIAAVIATSGSTGPPKAVELAASALVFSATSSLKWLGTSGDDTWLCCLPTQHIAGIQVLVRAIVNGTAPEIHQRFDAAAVARSKASFISLVPTMLRRLLAAGVNLGRFRGILLGGGPISADLRAQATAASARITCTYGMTETAGGCVYDGTALPGISITLDDGQRIRLAGPMLAHGYRLRPDLNQAAFDSYGFRTADIGMFTGDGRLHVLGRNDDVINTGGEKVVAHQVAETLTTHPAIAECAVFKRPDTEWGERVVAVIVPRNKSSAPTLPELRTYVISRLGAAAGPRELIVVESLPRLDSGKLDRRALQAMAVGEQLD